MLLEAPIVPTLLRLAVPNVLNLLAFAGMITFDGFFLGRISTNALAGGFCIYAALLVRAVTGVKTRDAAHKAVS
jgi:Na+-driven multidrug efflux pump